MNFIAFPFPYDECLTSQDILRTRREQLRLTQQQVAAGAKLQLRQYQRIESGERNLESATLKTALAICAVLKLDPYTFLPEGEIMNKYYELSERDTSSWETEESLTLLISQGCDLFNEKCGTNYSLDNIKVAFCTAENIVDVYRDFTQKYGFASEMKAITDFEDVLAEAFVGQTDIDSLDHVDGILIRLDLPKNVKYKEHLYQMTIIHELAHIFCSTHEIKTAGKAGQGFYDLYCAGKPGTPADQFNNGFMNAGYAIWRDFIAEIMQDIVFPQPSLHLSKIVRQLRRYADQIQVGNQQAKMYMVQYLAMIMNTWEGSEAEKWDDLEPRLKRLNLPFIPVIHHVFDILHDGNCHEIDPDSIEELGSMYMMEIIKCTSLEKITTYAAQNGLV